MPEQRLGQGPASVQRPEQILLGHFHVVEKGLAKSRRATERQHGLGLHTFALHVDQQKADALLLLAARIRAYQAEDPIGVLTVRGPSLLTADQEVIARIEGRSAQ